MYDTMQFVKCDVATLVIGQACSAGSLLAMAGTKGKRYALRNSRTMIHQPSGGYSGQATDILIHAEEITKINKLLSSIGSNRESDIEELKSVVSNEPNNKEKRYELAEKYLSSNEIGLGFNELLIIYEQDSKWNE